MKFIAILKSKSSTKHLTFKTNAPIDDEIMEQFRKELGPYDADQEHEDRSYAGSGCEFTIHGSVWPPDAHDIEMVGNFLFEAARQVNLRREAAEKSHANNMDTFSKQFSLPLED